MAVIRFDESANVKVLASPAGRRDALRSLGAAGMTLLNADEVGSGPGPPLLCSDWTSAQDIGEPR